MDSQQLTFGFEEEVESFRRVFLTLRESLLTFNHTEIFDNSSLTLAIRSESTFPEVNKFVSSANKNGREYLQTETRPFI